MLSAASLEPFGRTISTAEGQIFCYDSGGRKPPLLLIHGLGDEADTWQRVVGPLSAQWRVLAPDLPGFGRSPLPRRWPTLTAYARSLIALLDALGIAQTTLVGNSLGAAIGQRMVLARAARIARAVLVDGVLPIEPSAPNPALLRFLVPIQGERLYRSLRRDPAAAYATLAPYYHDIGALPSELREFLYRRVQARVWSEKQQRAFLGTLRCLAWEVGLRAAQWRAQLATGSTAATLIWGESDQIIPRSQGEAMAAWLGAEFHLIAACGHLPQQERPEALIALIGAPQ